MHLVVFYLEEQEDTNMQIESRFHGAYIKIVSSTIIPILFLKSLNFIYPNF